jgi:6-phospho-3-hexuloisomerase
MMTAKLSKTVPTQSRSPGDEALPRRGAADTPPPGTDAQTTLSRSLESSARLVLSENHWVLTRVNWPAVANLTSSISRAARIFVLGEGRSGLAVRMAAMRLMHLGLRVHVVGETTTPALNDGDVLIAASGSGDTPGVVMTAEQARTAG